MTSVVWVIIGLDAGLPPTWRQLTYLSIGPLETNFIEILIQEKWFPIKKMTIKMSSANCRPSCSDIHALMSWWYSIRSCKADRHFNVCQPCSIWRCMINPLTTGNTAVGEPCGSSCCVFHDRQFGDSITCSCTPTCLPHLLSWWKPHGRQGMLGQPSSGWGNSRVGRDGDRERSLSGTVLHNLLYNFSEHITVKSHQCSCLNPLVTWPWVQQLLQANNKESSKSPHC